jgi:hypothetical protein
VDEIAALDEMTHADYLEAFESAALPAELWTHYAHVRMAWLYLRAHSFAGALRTVRDGILNYNTKALGKPEAYHETITVLFTHIIHLRMRPGQTWADFVSANPDLVLRSGPLMATYYSEQHLFSDAARVAFLPPDLKELPQQGLVETVIALDNDQQKTT